MVLSAARCGGSFGVFVASCSLLGCSAVLGYETDYDDTRGPGGAIAGVAGVGGAAAGQAGAAGLAQAGRGGAASGQGGAASGQGGATGGQAGSTSGQGGTASGQGGTASGQAGSTSGQGGGGGQPLAGQGGGGQSGGGQSGGGQSGAGPAGGQSGATQGGAAGSSIGGAGGQAGFLSGGAGGGQAGNGGVAGSAAGNAGSAGAAGSTGGLGGNAGASGFPACVIPTAPTTTCGDVLAARDNCGACGLSCGTQGECKAGRCVLDPIAKAPYARNTGYFGQPLAALSTANSDRLLYRAQVDDPTVTETVQALYDISLSDDLPLVKRLGTSAITVNGVSRPVTGWKSARFVPSTTQVIGVAAVARIPNEYPQDRVLVSLDRSTGNVLQTFQLSGDANAREFLRPPVGGMYPGQETGDVVALGQKRGVVWDFVAGPTGGAVLRGFPVPLSSTGVFDTVAEPRHAIAASLVSLFDYAYFLSQATMNAPFKLKTIKLEAGAVEYPYGDGNMSFVHPTGMAIVTNALFVADAGGDPAALNSPDGKLYRYDLSTTCTKIQPQPVLVAQNLERLIAVAADATHVYTLEVRDDGTGSFSNVLRRRFHDGTGESVLLVEPRDKFFLTADYTGERAERLGKGLVLGQSYKKPMIFFGLGSDPAEYREPNEYIFGLPR